MFLQYIFTAVIFFILLSFMKKTILIAFFLTVCLEVFAQKDTSKPDGYIPLFDNLTTPEEALPENFNGKFKTVSADDSTKNIDVVIENLKTLYNSGRFRESLEKAFVIKGRQYEEKLSKQQKEDFHKYAIASLKEMGYGKTSDSLMKIFCRQAPFYKIKDDDPVAFVSLKKNFISRPVFGVKVTISKVYPIVVLDTVYTVRAKDGKYIYSNFKASSSEIQAVFYPFENVSLSGGFAFSKFSYTRLEAGENVYFSYTEKDKFFSIPAEVSYIAPAVYGVVRPEFFAGIKYSVFYESTYSIKDLKRSEVVENKRLDSVYCEGRFKDQKSRFMTVYGGIRLNYEYHRFCAFAGLSYGFATKELRKPEDKYKNPELAVNHLFIPDAMRLNQISLSFGVKINMFYRTLPKYGYGY